MKPVSNILHKVFNKDKLNILTGITHEAFETNLTKTGHNFYAFQHSSFKKWMNQYREPPANYYILPEGKLPDIEFDLALSQNKFGQFQVLSDLAARLHIPLISLEHTLPMPGWPSQQLEGMNSLRGNWNVFISQMQIPAWRWQDKGDTQVITHAIADEFVNTNNKRKNHILTVANDYINRDWCLGYQQYKRVTEGLPVHPVGDTQGLSRPAKDLDELISFYQTSRIFLNTAHVSPIPMSLIEAMACGCAAVSVRASAIPEFVEHGVTGFLYDTDKEARYYLELLLKDEELAIELGSNAAVAIREKCSLERFVNEWNVIFDAAKEMYFGQV
jgi:hypothetical protein